MVDTALVAALDRSDGRRHSIAWGADSRSSRARLSSSSLSPPYGDQGTIHPTVFPPERCRVGTYIATWGSRIVSVGPPKDLGGGFFFSFFFFFFFVK